MPVLYELPTELPRNRAEENHLLQVGQALHQHYVALCLAKTARTVHAFLDAYPDVVELQLEVEPDGTWSILFHDMDGDELSEHRSPDVWEAHTTIRKAFDTLAKDLGEAFDAGAFEALSQRYGQTTDRVENDTWLTLSDARIMLHESLDHLRHLTPTAPAPVAPSPARRRPGRR